MKKIVTIVGARPQFIKAAVLSRIIYERTEINEIIVHTGQHFDTNMSAVFFDEMSIPKPHYHFTIHSLPRKEMITAMTKEIINVLVQEQPEVVVVYGDTNSTLAGALAASKMNIKLVHIEAGLRSFNLNMPEEVNRIKTDSLSDLLLCPSETAMHNISKENSLKENAVVINCGDIMKDSVKYYSRFSEEKSTILKDLNLVNKRFVLATIHRQENTDNIENLQHIFESLEKIHTKETVVLPLHPRTRKAFEKHNLKFNIQFIDPIGYFDMLSLLKNCSLVITDSGGLQKEAFFCKKYCIIAREETEWIELVTNGFATIVGSDPNKILDAFNTLNTNEIHFTESLYGTNVGSKIYNEIKNLLD